MNKWLEENPDSTKWRKTMILWYQNNTPINELSSDEEQFEDDNPQGGFWAPGDINFEPDKDDQSEEDPNEDVWSYRRHPDYGPWEGDYSWK